MKKEKEITLSIPKDMDLDTLTELNLIAKRGMKNPKEEVNTERKLNLGFVNSSNPCTEIPLD